MLFFSWIIVLFGIIGWTGFYWILCYLDRSKKPEWHCRLVTIIHGTTVSALSAWNAFVVGPWPLTNIGEPNTLEQEFTMAICLSYFFFDLAWCLLHKTEGPVMLLHHIVSIGTIFLCMYMGHSGCEIVAAIGGGEASNPVLQLRWFMLESGWKGTWEMDAVEYTFVAVFFYMRLYVGTHLLIGICTHPRSFIWMQIGAVTMYLISIVFVVMVAKFAFKKLQKINGSKDMVERNGLVNTKVLTSKEIVTQPTCVLHDCDKNGNIKLRNGFTVNGRDKDGQSTVSKT
ncbi:TLC domain-containing protein 5-like isoform X1 [Tachypleus tridentatus]|uniref:TLC domain-containing protein 5-like isoform X1 n=1 Tax=Tachypleus tridentatus TaxID=6853 RepID=UPI003FD191F9